MRKNDDRPTELRGHLHLFADVAPAEGEFPRLPSYQRCVELLPRCAIALAAYFESVKGQCSGLSIADSTPIVVCHNLRIYQHRVFRGLAARGKSSTG